MLLLLFLGIGFAPANGLPEELPQSEEIVLGMSTALSGPAATLGNDMRQGVMAGFEAINRAGGVHGRSIRLIALDDGYEPSRTAPNMRQLIQEDHVVAVIGNVGTPTAIAAAPICREQKTVLFAPFTGASMLRKKPVERYLIHFRTSYIEEVEAMVAALIDGAGLKPEDIALFTQRDSYGDAGFTASIASLMKRGLKSENGILHVSYERNTLAVENALATLLYAQRQPRAVLMVGAYGPCAKFIKLASESGLNAVFLIVSFVGSRSLAAELGAAPAHVIVTQVVPDPESKELKLVGEFRNDLKALDPHASPGFGSLEGYIAARIFLKALDAIPGKPAREEIINAIEGLGSFDLGLGQALSLGTEDHQACHQIWPTILRDGRFVPFQWSEISRLTSDQNPK